MDTAVQEVILLGKIIFASLLAGLVGATSTFLVLMAVRAVTFLGADQTLIRTDPIRILEAIVVGISFLGAGTILKNAGWGEEAVEGLTTSASILSVAAVGIVVGFEAYILAAGVTLWNVFINWGLRVLALRWKRGSG